ncbi:hypothetical protein [Zunongwangia atlantica]|uniref:Uncharacterized protein n=1 Tax=Zunongwangia atlantica 22II14-10F7 TaxID=1185767 RepID=A0A1Y1T9X9_9FLAO|nr:hypothetical protein [Zunongwangia atlantica]ORL47183.1 hypothetical protein IIF7_00425 [Zunongwangia atlantica 22II14-10F7]
MKFKEIMSSKKYWRSVVILGFLFVLIYNIVMMVIDYGGFAFKDYYQDRMADGKMITFVVGQVLGMLVYGMIVSYGQFRRKEKDQLKK